MIDEIKTYESHRIETGALKINYDWTGLFIRGDDALSLSLEINDILEYFKDKEIPFHLKMALKTLEIYKDIVDSDIKM